MLSPFQGRRKNHLAHWHMRTTLLGRPVGFKSSLTLEELPRGLSGKRIHLPVKEMQETWVRSLGQEDPLEKEMTFHSSTIAWKIPWTEEPGRLQSMGSQRVGHD